MNEDQGNADEPQLPEPSTPLEIGPVAATVHPLVVVGALVLATIGCVVPVLTMFASLTYSLTWAVTAEYLQWTSGLEPATFGGGFWIASVANSACFAEAIRRRVAVQDRDRENPWMPLLGLCIVYVLGLSTTLYAELGRRIDVPDVIHAALLIGFFELVALVLPPLLLLVVLRALRTAWRVSMASAASARRVTGLSTAIGICSAFLVSSFVVGSVKGYLEREADDETDGPTEIFGNANFVEGLRAAFEAEAETLQGASLVPASRPERRTESPVNACVESLFRQQSRGATLTQILASRIAWKYKLPGDVAEEVVIKKLFDVCEQHVVKPIDDLGGYLATATHNAAKDAARVKRNRFNFGVEGDADYEPLFSPEEIDSIGFRQLDRCFKERLGPRERELIRLRFLDVDNATWRTAGEAVGMSVAAAEKAGQRALDKLRACFGVIPD